MYKETILSFQRSGLEYGGLRDMNTIYCPFTDISYTYLTLIK